MKMERDELSRQLDLTRSSLPVVDSQLENQMISLQSENQMLSHKVTDLMDLIESQKVQITFMEQQRQEAATDQNTFQDHIHAMKRLIFIYCQLRIIYRI